MDDFFPVYQLADRYNERQNHGVVRIRAILEFSNYCAGSATLLWAQQDKLEATTLPDG